MNKIFILLFFLIILSIFSYGWSFNSAETPPPLTINLLSNFFCLLTGCTFTGNINFTGNIHIDGNFSSKRPYWNGYDNSTQNFLNINNAQVMNISNNNDYNNWLIEIVGNQNVTFKQSGDYQMTVMPEFYQATGSNKIITFWIQKNGIDVPWSNSRWTMQNGAYTAPSIIYQFDINNPETDSIRVMWYSDSTASQIISISGLTSPIRPSIPGVLLNVQKVSEITP